MKSVVLNKRCGGTLVGGILRYFIAKNANCAEDDFTILEYSNSVDAEKIWFRMNNRGIPQSVGVVALSQAMLLATTLSFLLIAVVQKSLL